MHRDHDFCEAEVWVETAEQPNEHGRSRGEGIPDLSPWILRGHGIDGERVDVPQSREGAEGFRGKSVLDPVEDGTWRRRLVGMKSM